MKNITYADTKQLIVDKYKELAVKKPVSKITISEIISQCNINRKTFYYHFKDIFSLLEYTFHEDMIDIINKIYVKSDLESVLTFIFEYIEENNAFLKNVYYSVGKDKLNQMFYNDFADIVSKVFDDEIEKSNADSEYKKFLTDFCTGAIISYLHKQMIEYPDVDEDKSVKYIMRTIKSITSFRT